MDRNRLVEPFSRNGKLLVWHDLCHDSVPGRGDGRSQRPLVYKVASTYYEVSQTNDWDRG